MTGWQVYEIKNIRGAVVPQHVDTVFFQSDMDKDQVKRALQKDGFSQNIAILKEVKS